jgi:hypothetical protein
MKLELCHADTCLPDYWSGHHRPYLCVPVHKNMSLKSIKDALRNELRQGAVGGSGDDARLLGAAFVAPDEARCADALVRAAYAAIARLAPAKKGQRRFFTDLDDLEGDEDMPVCAYFVFMEV